MSADPAVRAIAEIVHDIDLKDAAHRDDTTRWERASAALDDLYEDFRTKGR